jgi:E3 ubiquitin-protein ligase HERC2
MSLVPKAVASLEQLRILRAACGGNHTLCLTPDGGLLSWGMNNVGQLGHGTNKNSPVPKQVTALTSRVQMVACGYEFSAAISAEGQLFIWGDMDYERTQQRASSVPVAIPGFQRCKDLVCGDYHILVTTP